MAVKRVFIQNVPSRKVNVQLAGPKHKSSSEKPWGRFYLATVHAREHICEWLAIVTPRKRALLSVHRESKLRHANTCPVGFLHMRFCNGFFRGFLRGLWGFYSGFPVDVPVGFLKGSHRGFIESFLQGSRFPADAAELFCLGLCFT